jgi:hypothetical protein
MSKIMEPQPKRNTYLFGRQVFGLGAISFGVVTLVWHTIYELGNISHSEVLIYIIGAAELIGGLAILWMKTARYGALTISVIFLIFTLYWVPQIVSNPLVFAYWGNSFEKFSIFLGGVFVFASTIQNNPIQAAKITKAAYIAFGISVISFALYQLFYLEYTASLVPKWIPPGQMFWAVATTVAFALAAIAILWGRSVLLASGLLTAMIVGFGVLIWIPDCFTAPHVMSNWIENSANLGIAGSAWIFTDLLYQSKISPIKWGRGRAQVEDKTV